jgi:DNA-directed RNA polymerase alpha subunit
MASADEAERWWQGLTELNKVGVFEHMQWEVRLMAFGHTDIDGLEELGTRSYNCLHRAGIRTVAQLLSFSASDLLQLPSLGATTLGEISNALGRYGLSLKSPD